MIKKISYLKNRYSPKGSFAANVLTLMTGTIIAQAIPIAISPILTRIYKPEDFGIFALYMSLASIISVIATGQYEIAVMLPEKDEDAFNLVALSVIIAFCVSSITLFALWILNSQIISYIGNSEISQWLYFIPLTILLTGIYNPLNYWINRKKQYKRLAINRVSQSTASAATNLGMGLNGFGASGLIVGGIAGQSIGTAALGWYAWREDKQKIKLIKKNKVIENAKKYQDFPKFNAIQAFFDSFRLNGIVFLTTNFFNLTILGYYSFAIRILQAPLSIIGSSVSQVFYQNAANAHNSKKDIWIIVKRTIIKLGIITLPIFLIGEFFATDLISIIFGNTWREVGIYIKILLPWVLINFISSPISTIPLILNKQKQFLYVGLGYNILIPGIFILSTLFSNDIINIFWAISITGSLYLLGIILWIRKISIESGEGFTNVDNR